MGAGGVTPEVALAVLDRRRCERCRGLENRSVPGGRFVVHHKHLKGMGGTKGAQWRNDPDRLALLHDSCHRWAHANPREAMAQGLIVSRFAPTTDLRADGQADQPGG